MRQIYEKLLEELKAGRPAALVRVIASSGSAPRGAGAAMALFADGSSLGSIGGGSVEHAALARAGAALSLGSGETLHYGLHPGGAGELGMVCGGSVTLSIACIPGGDPGYTALLARILAHMDAGRDLWLVSLLRDGLVADAGVYTREKGLECAREIQAPALLPLLGTGAVLGRGEPALFVEPLGFSGCVYIFGGGHVAAELAPVLSHVDFCVRVLEDRAEFADLDRFPGAREALLLDFADIGSRISLTEADYAVIMTRGHVSDYGVLAQVLRQPLRYVGMIGSRSKRAATYARLRQEGFGEEDIARIHSPIGLDIGAESPAEIAISIAAELIRVRAGG